MKKVLFIMALVLIASSAIAATKTVYAEDFGYVGWQYCPVVREAFTHIREDYTVDEVVTVENNTTYGGAYASFRKTYCGVSAVPVKKVDFIHSSLGGGGSWSTHYNWLATNIDSQALKSAPGTLALTFDETTNTVNMHCTLTLDSSISGTHKVWMMVTENSDCVEDNKPHHYVRAGTTTPHTVTISSSGQSQQFDWSFDKDPSWTNNLYGVAFLEEDFGSKEVLQAKQITIFEHPAPGTFGLLTPANHAEFDVFTTNTVEKKDLAAMKLEDTKKEAIASGNNPVGSVTINFSWEASAGAVNYDLMVDDNSDFSSPEVDVTGLTSTTYNRQINATETVTYYWRVTAGNATAKLDCNEDFDFTLNYNNDNVETKSLGNIKAQYQE